MGLLSRLRASSSSSKPKDPSRPQTPSFHTATSSSTSHLAPPTPLSPVRSNIAPSISSTRHEKEGSIRFGKWRKAKDKAGAKDKGLGGTACEDLPSPPLLSVLPNAGDRSSPIQIGGEERSPRPTPADVTASPTLVASPTESAFSSRVPVEGNEQNDKMRMPSDEWKKEGGILGKLTFESEAIAIPVTASQALSDGLVEGKAGSYAASIESGVLVEPIDATPPPISSTSSDLHTSVHAPAGSSSNAVVDRNMEEDAIEQLESPEKKSFWKSKVCARRASKAASEKDVDVRSFTPTPRKSSTPLPAAEITPTKRAIPAVELEHPRPQALRPASSFFKNPFPRSASQASVYDLDNPPPAGPGSFELKGWRHVSGTSTSLLQDAEGDGGYFTTRHSSIADLSSSGPLDSAGSYDLRRPTLSRPPSIAASMTSFEEHTASRVSVAAFRKGIRRPSVDPGMTFSDPGHGTRDEDDDDLPLGMMRRPAQDASSTSVSKLRSAIPPASPSIPEATTLPAAKPPFPKSPEVVQDGIFMTAPPRRTSPSGFVVKSARSSRHLTESPAPASGPRMRASSIQQNQPIFVDPLPSRNSTPALLSLSPANGIPEELLASPADIAPALELFQSLSTQRSSPPLPSAAATAARSRTPPPVEPIKLPTPRTAAFDIPEDDMPFLPLPPDQMPPSPVPGEERTVTPPSTGRAKRASSILQEPLRVLSGIWGSPGSNPEDGFDAGLVLRGMQALGADENERATSPSPARPSLVANLAPEDKSSKQSPPDAGMDSIAGLARPVAEHAADDSLEELAQTRLDLQARLAAAAGPSPTKPSLPKIKTGQSASRPAERKFSKDDLRSATSEKSATSTVQSSFARAPASRLKGRVSSNMALCAAAARQGGGWSSSEEDEEDQPTSRGARKVSGASTTSASNTKSSSSKPPKEQDCLKSSLPASPSSSDEEGAIPLSKIRSNTSKGSGPGSAAPSPALASSSSLGMGNPVAHSSFVNVRKSAIAPLPRSASSNSVRFSIDLDTAPPATKRTTSGLSARPISGAQIASKSTVSLPAMPHNGIGRSHDTPASSQSGLTGDSAVQIVTPHGSISSQSQSQETRAGKDAKTAVPPTSKGSNHATSDSLSSMDQLETRQRRFSQPAAQQQQQTWATQGGGMNMPGVPMGMGMDPAAYHAYMKQQFQAQWMAAAYRASEEEWERASALSGGGSHAGGESLHSSQSFATMPTMPMAHFAHQQPYALPGWTPHYSAYSSPHFAHPAYSPHAFAPPQAPFAWSQHAAPGQGGGLYSYSGGSRSVYGGEFGPLSRIPGGPPPVIQDLPVRDQTGRSTSAQHTPEKDKRSSLAQSRSTSTAKLANAPARPDIRAPNRVSGSPPSSWRKSGDWSPHLHVSEEPTTPRGKARPKPQVA